jgi:hypothetical protein
MVLWLVVVGGVMGVVMGSERDLLCLTDSGSSTSFNDVSDDITEEVGPLQDAVVAATFEVSTI